MLEQKDTSFSDFVILVLIHSVIESKMYSSDAFIWYQQQIRILYFFYNFRADEVDY